MRARELVTPSLSQSYTSRFEKKFRLEINIEVFLTYARVRILNSALSTLTHARTARLNRSSSLVYSNRQSLLLSRQSLFLFRLIALTEGRIKAQSNELNVKAEDRVYRHREQVVQDGQKQLKE
ncbi:hypothetical protein P8452_75566 [Trifolium repens]|nr:hypothetical protein P8452_75566 [Trifolium repens]